MRIPAVYAALTAFSVLPLIGCSWINGDPISADFHTTIASAPKTLEVDNAVGAIKIDAWDTPSVEVNATKRGPTDDAVNAIKITVEPSGQTLTVTTHFPSGLSNVKVEYTIHAPADTALRLEQGVGAISTTGFTGDVHEHTSTGAIASTMAKLGGSQRVHIDVSVGAISLVLPSDTDAAITASTSVGAIKSDFPLSLDRTMVGQNGQGKIGNGSAVADLSVSTGAIAIQRE